MSTPHQPHARRAGADDELKEEVRFYILRAHPGSVLWTGLRLARDQEPHAPLTGAFHKALIDTSTLRYTIEKDDPAQTWWALQEMRRGQVLQRLLSLLAPARSRIARGVTRAHPYSASGVIAACALSDEECWAATWLAILDYAFAHLQDWPSPQVMRALHEQMKVLVSS